MYKLFFLGFIIISLNNIAQSPLKYSISGGLKNAPENSYIYLHQTLDNKTITDSAKVKSEKFNFNGKINETNMFWMTKSRNNSEQPNLFFFVDGGKTSISGNYDSLPVALVDGGQTQKDNVELNSLMKSFNMKQQAIESSYNTAKTVGDVNKMNEVVAEYKTLEQTIKESFENFIKTHSKSAVSCYAIYYNHQNSTAPIDELERVVKLLDKSVLNTKYGKLAQEKIVQLRGTSIGYEAANFAQADPNGKLISLTDFKGKYVLVDFWASWCGPCRAENPNLVKAYNKYKDKNFTILGVSFDQSKDKWIQAVSKDKLNWTQISDLKGWGNEAGKIYGIRSIPSNLLIDKEGKIVAKDLRGNQLEEKLEELLNH